MGYQTYFQGGFSLDKPLTREQQRTLEDFSEARHEQEEQVAEGMPSFWCQWIPTSDGDSIEWDGGEKFYYYEEWIKYLLKKFLIPWGYKVNGSVDWDGEESGDVGQIVIKDNKITIYDGIITFVKRK